MLGVQGQMARPRAVGEVAVKKQVVRVLRRLYDPWHDGQDQEPNEQDGVATSPSHRPVA